MKATSYIITAQTNLHAGSGDANYGIIDKLIQRDALTDLPAIHASSLKGGILEHVKNKGASYKEIADIFGQQSPERQKQMNGGLSSDEGKRGDFVFMQAQLLSLPVRSNIRPFFRVSSDLILEDLKTTLIQTGIKTKVDALIKIIDSVMAQAKTQVVTLDNRYDGKYTLEHKKNIDFVKYNGAEKTVDLVALLGEYAIVVPHNTYLKEFADNNHLPVIARNFLNNGQSENLWYEQIVPRQTRFFTAILTPSQYSGKFDEYLTGLVQLGGNATVGYGYCELKKMF